MKLSGLGLCLALATALSGCGGDDRDGGSATAGTGGTGGAAGNAGGTPGAAGGGFVACGAGKAYCNGACVGVGETAAGCHNVASLPIIWLIADDALYYGSADVAAGKLDLTTFADTPFAPEPFRHFGLALDATHVYYATLGTTIDAQPRIDRVPRAGGTVEPVVPDLMLDSPMSRLQMLNGKLFFLTEGLVPPGGLMQVEGTTTRPVLGDAKVVDYTADATHLYFIASTGVFSAALARAPLSNLEAVETLVQSADAEQLALLGNDLYWLSGTTLMRAPKAGGTGTAVGGPLGAAGGTPGAIAHVDSAAVYLWTYGKDEDSLWAYKPGAAQPALLARLQHNFFDQPVVTSTATKLYVTRPYGIFELSK